MSNVSAGSDASAENVSTETIHRLESPRGRVAVEYRWAGDRFVHRVLVDGQVCLSSVDGDGSQAWPASPPIQQVSLEPIQDVPMILGVGAAGKGHWSISVGWQAGPEQADPEQAESEQAGGDRENGEFLFDIACRVKESPDFLGSTYASGPGARESLELNVALGTKAGKDDRITIAADREGEVQTYRWVYSLRAR